MSKPNHVTGCHNVTPYLRLHPHTWCMYNAASVQDLIHFSHTVTFIFSGGLINPDSQINHRVTRDSSLQFIVVLSCLVIKAFLSWCSESWHLFELMCRTVQSGTNTALQLERGRLWCIVELSQIKSLWRPDFMGIAGFGKELEKNANINKNLLRAN